MSIEWQEVLEKRIKILDQEIETSENKLKNDNSIADEMMLLSNIERFKYTRDVLYQCVGEYWIDRL